MINQPYKTNKNEIENGGIWLLYTMTKEI